MDEASASRNAFQDSIANETSVLVSRLDGQVIGQSRAACQLLGRAGTRPCWSLMRRVSGAERLPCAEGCVKARLFGKTPVAVHSVALRGADYELRCEAVGDQIVTTLRAEPRDVMASLEDSEGLTPREIEVLRLLAEGLEGREIAQSLGIRPGTVRTHVEHMRQRLGCRTRAGLVAHGFRLRYLRH